MTIENVIHLIANDPIFAEAIRKDTNSTLEAKGFKLCPEELNALKAAMIVVRDTDKVLGIISNPSDWFVSQFKGAIDNPSDWFLAQFHNEVA